MKNIAIEDELHQRLKTYSASKGMKLGSLISNILTDNITKLEEEKNRIRIQELLNQRKIKEQ